MYSQRLSAEKARIKLPSTRTAITSPSPIESIHSSTSTHSSNTLSPTISNTSNESSSNVSSTSNTSSSRSRSSSSENMKMKQEQKSTKNSSENVNVIKNEPPKSSITTERRRRLSDPRCFPLLYECYAQARVRIGYELSSQHLTDLPQGSIVTVEEIHCDNRRARISAPIHGWLSLTSKHGGNTILMPLNKQTAKIGGKVMFNYNHYRHHGINNNNNMPITAKIIDYNQNYDMHKVQHKNGKHEWLNLKDKSITYIPNGVPMMVNPIKQTEKFFLRFFTKDYPEFVPKQSNNNNGRYNHSVQQSRAQQLHQSQLLHQLHQKQMQQRANNKYSHSSSKQFKLNGHDHKSRTIYGHSHGHNHNHNHSRNAQKILHQMNAQNHHYHRYHNNNNNGNGNGAGIDKTQNNQNRFNNDKVRYNALNTMNHLNGNKNKDECKDDIKSDQENMDKPQTDKKEKKTSPEEFRRKIKEIERKIIDHLHKRGYYEDSKEFWVYIRKAKEMAIEKAKKERAKYLAREKAKAEAEQALKDKNNKNGNNIDI